VPAADEQFSAPYDKVTKTLSAAVCALVALVALVTGNLYIAAAGAVLIGACYAWSPRGYSIAERSILIDRLIGTVRISLDGVREARRATADDFTGCIRLFGNGGLFGYYGLFRTSRLGKSHWYLTNRASAVVVVTPEKTVLVSPQDPERFLAVLRSSVTVPPAPPAPPGQAYESSVLRSFGPLFGIAIAAIVLVVVALAFTYKPGPPSYTLTADSLAIHDRFYPVTLQASQVVVSGIRVIDLRTDTQWRPVERTNGFANSHYASGWFRLADGRKVRMYNAADRRLVLLPAADNGTTVLLDSRDPDAFAAELRRKWSAGS